MSKTNNTKLFFLNCSKNIPLWLLLVASGLGVIFPPGASFADDLRQKLLANAATMLDQYQVSYVYGGAGVPDEASCHSCFSCLKEKSPSKETLLTACSDCNKCGLDCSHFVHLVFHNSGVDYPYLPTATMIDSDPKHLQKNYNFIDLGRNLDRALPGDLLVYQGHVVFLEKIERERDQYWGDIIHVTSGREVKGPGMALQRKRYADLANFKGALQRILRHKDLTTQACCSQNEQKPFRPIRAKAAKKQ
ncbi:MAG: hypothetical protein AB7T49_06020 [Oligoflexales bacterium]